MTPKNPTAAQARRNRLRQRFGHGTGCLRCGLIDLTCLVDVERSLLEGHHVLGKTHVPDLIVAVCRNCHAILSAAQLDDEVPLAPQPNLLARLLAVVAALGSFLRVLAEALLGWAAKGRQFVSGLDTDFPTWRAKPWAA